MIPYRQYSIHVTCIISSLFRYFKRFLFISSGIIYYHAFVNAVIVDIIRFS